MSVQLGKLNLTYSQDPEPIEGTSGVNWKAVATVVGLTIFMVAAFYIVGLVFSQSKKSANQARLNQKTAAVRILSQADLGRVA
jgi:hypothetical protein